MSELPSGWTTTHLGDIGDVRLGKMLDKAKNQGLPTQYLRNINVRWFRFDLTDLQILLVSEDERELLSVQDGDLFICEGGEPGRCAVWRNGTNSLVYQKALHRFRTGGAIVPELLMYCLRHDADSGALQDAFTGTTIKHLTRESLLQYEIPLPPINEQKRIAEKLDAVLARVDACRERLDRVPAILKRFRQAVLAAATSGRLTEEWREEDGSEAGYFALLGTLGEIVAGQSPSAAEVNYEGRGELYVTGPEQWDGHRIIQHKWTEYPKRIAPENSIFVTVKGAGVGKTFPGCRAAIGRDVYAFVPHAQHNREYVLLSIQASIEDIIAKAKGLIPGLSKSDLTGHEIYLPTADEQDEIVRRVEALFAYADRFEARYTAARGRIEGLTPALLSKAFHGELVPQDPNDEPASVLLERIRAARATSEGATGTKRRKGSGRPKISKEAEVLMLTRKDVQDTHLTTILKERGPLTAEALWSASQLDIDDFYDQLKDEEARGLLREKRGDSSNAPRTLEAA